MSLRWNGGQHYVPAPAGYLMADGHGSAAILDEPLIGTGGGGGDCITDEFGRSLTGGWGMSDAGLPWITDPGVGGATFGVDGSKAYIDAPAQSGLAELGDETATPPTNTRDMPFDMTVDVDVTSTNGTLFQSQVAIGCHGDFANLELRLFLAAGIVEIENGAFDGNETATGIDLSVPLRVHVRKEVGPAGNQTRLFANVWPVTDPEPAGWLVDDSKYVGQDTYSILDISNAHSRVEYDNVAVVGVDGCSGGVLDTFAWPVFRVSDGGYRWRSGRFGDEPHPGFDSDGSVGRFHWDTGDDNFTWSYGGFAGGVVPSSVVDLQFDVRFNEATGGPPPTTSYNALILINAAPLHQGNDGGGQGTYGQVFGHGPAIGVDVYRNFNGTGTPVDPGFTIGAWWTIRYYCDNVGSKIKAWPQGDAEPAGWLVEFDNPFTNGDSWDPLNGRIVFWHYVDTSIDNFLDRRTFYPITRRRQVWESFWQEDTGLFDIPPEWTVGGSEAVAFCQNDSGFAILLCDSDLGASDTTITRITAGGEFAGDWNMVIEFAYGALVDYNQHFKAKVWDGGAHSIEADLIITTVGGSIGFVGGSSAAFSWASYSPSPFNFDIGSSYFIRWVHTASGDTLAVWEDGTSEPSPQVSQGATAGWAGGDRITLAAQADSAGTADDGGFIGVYFIDPTGDGSGGGGGSVPDDTLSEGIAGSGIGH